MPISNTVRMHYLVEIELPFAWQCSPTPACREAQFANAALLALLDHHPESHPHDRPATDHHWQRIEAKLDIILQLLVRSGSLPPLVPHQRLRLAPQQISWQCNTTLAAGTLLQLQITIEPRFPQPLVFCATVTGTAEAGWVTAELHLDDPLVAEAWEHWLFRHHRRHIAKAKQG